MSQRLGLYCCWISYIASVENGQRNVSIIIKIANALNVTSIFNNNEFEKHKKQ